MFLLVFAAKRTSNLVQQERKSSQKKPVDAVSTSRAQKRCVVCNALLPYGTGDDQAAYHAHVESHNSFLPNRARKTKSTINYTDPPDAVPAASSVVRPEHDVNFDDGGDDEAEGALQVSETSCPACGKVYSDKKGVAKHLQKVHPKVFAKLSFKCRGSGCNRSFMSLEGCVKHESFAHNLKRSPGDFVQCSICKKPLLRENMENHLNRAHQQALVTKKPVSVSKKKSKARMCAFCPLLFLDEAQLREHESHHQEVARIKAAKKKKPFCCKLCNRPCSNLLALRTHHSRAHADRSFALQKVPGVGAFLSKKKKKNKAQPLRILKAESVKHSEANVVPTFDCQVCTSKFYSEYSLTTHTRREHPDYVVPVEAETGTVKRGLQTLR